MKIIMLFGITWIILSIVMVIMSLMMVGFSQDGDAVYEILIGKRKLNLRNSIYYIMILPVYIIWILLKGIWKLIIWLTK